MSSEPGSVRYASITSTRGSHTGESDQTLCVDDNRQDSFPWVLWANGFVTNCRLPLRTVHDKWHHADGYRVKTRCYVNTFSFFLSGVCVGWVCVCVGGVCVGGWGVWVCGCVWEKKKEKKGQTEKKNRNREKKTKKKKKKNKSFTKLTKRKKRKIQRKKTQKIQWKIIFLKNLKKGKVGKS